MKNRLFDIGKMRHRVTLYTVTRVDDGAGGFERQDPSVPTELGTFWARVDPVSAKERQWGEQFTELTTHQCWLRYNAAVLPGMILRHKGADHYIESVYDPDNLKEFIFLTLREGGPM
jgi:SPP1 family predicted phage head-tail adaptor